MPPIEGLPDRKIHRLCIACRRWFWPADGVLDFPFATGPLTWVLRRLAVALDDESRMRFYCRECHAEAAKKAERLRRSMLGGMIMLTAVLIGLWIAWSLGAFDGLIPQLRR